MRFFIKSHVNHTVAGLTVQWTGPPSLQFNAIEKKFMKSTVEHIQSFQADQMIQVSTHIDQSG